jgi:hypothetical protein
MPPNNGNAGEAATRVLCQRPYVIRRFYRPATEVSPTTEKACGKGAESKFCAALQRARELELFDPWQELCSPLTPGVQLVNLSHSEDGQMLRVDLGDDWKRMFEQLPLIGEGLVMTRNEAAILGRCMTFPELAFTTHGIKGASERGGLWLDFRALGAARAVHLRCESGHIFGVEFADGAGHTIHRFTATPTSNLEMFLGWVRLHQACSEPRRSLRKTTRGSWREATPWTTVPAPARYYPSLPLVMNAGWGFERQFALAESSNALSSSRSPCRPSETGGSPATMWSVCTFAPRGLPMPKSRHNSTSASPACCFTP